VLDYFPIEGAQKSVREVAALYAHFGHAERIGMHEGYHGHEYSAENQQFALQFLDHFNGLAGRRELSPVQQVNEDSLKCTRTGQVMLEYPNARSLMDVIREYYLQHKDATHLKILQLYYSALYPGIREWTVSRYQGLAPRHGEIRWESTGTSQFEGVTIDRYLLHHSGPLELPLLYIHKPGQKRTLFWLGEHQKITDQDWPRVKEYLAQGFDVVSIDPRGMGETRMAYNTTSPEDPTLTQSNNEQAYFNSLSSVLADYVYNSLLTGRPYFFQMIDDVAVAQRFIRNNAKQSDFAITGTGSANVLASAVSEIFPDIKFVPQSEVPPLKWSDIVTQKSEIWPLEYLLPGGAYVH
jgi:hypothetical protein